MHLSLDTLGHYDLHQFQLSRCVLPRVEQLFLYTIVVKNSCIHWYQYFSCNSKWQWINIKIKISNKQCKLCNTYNSVTNFISVKTCPQPMSSCSLFSRYSRSINCIRLLLDKLNLPVDMSRPTGWPAAAYSSCSFTMVSWESWPEFLARTLGITNKASAYACTPETFSTS